MTRSWPLDAYKEPIFRVGLHAAAVEHRSAIPATAEHYAGLPATDPQTGEPVPCGCPRCGAVRAEQDARLAQGTREIPATDPATVMREWAANPANRMSKFAQMLAERPELMPASEVEPGPGEHPRPGGLVERLAAQHRERRELMDRVNRSGQMS